MTAATASWAGLALVALLPIACSNPAAEQTAPGAGDAATDAGSDGAAPLDAGADVVDGPGEAGAPCAFNRDCHSALRCECDLDAGCACAPGPRGSGQNGTDRCDGGNDCASSLCVEGPGGAYYCSGECVTATDCTGALPLCSDIAFVGRICVRDAGP